MEDLVQWLRAQLDDEESVAFTAGHHLDGELDLRWTSNGAYVWPEGVTANEAPIVGCALLEEMPGYEVARARALHIEGHDPDRVMREIDAKRQLIARGGPFCTSGCDEPGNQPMDPETNWTTPLEHHFDCAAYKAAAVLALPYADRPGYREEWRP